MEKLSYTYYTMDPFDLLVEIRRETIEIDAEGNVIEDDDHLEASECSLESEAESSSLMTENTKNKCNNKVNPLIASSSERSAKGQKESVSKMPRIVDVYSLSASSSERSAKDQQRSVSNTPRIVEVYSLSEEEFSNM